MNNELCAYIDGKKVGTFVENNGQITFSYVDNPSQHISLSMPASRRTHKNKSSLCCLWGLLPDNQQALGNMAREADTGQFFPRFTWATIDSENGGLFAEGDISKQGVDEDSKYGAIGEVIEDYIREDNITDEIKKLYRDALGTEITGDDIFHFVYGKLHDPGYRETYAADLEKMLPHIETPATREKFDKFTAAGEKLMELHVGYEDVEPWPLTIDVRGDESDRETWRVVKMAWAKKKDPEIGNYVNDVTT